MARTREQARRHQRELRARKRTEAVAGVARDCRVEDAVLSKLKGFPGADPVMAEVALRLAQVLNDPAWMTQSVRTAGGVDGGNELSAQSGRACSREACSAARGSSTASAVTLPRADGTNYTAAPPSPRMASLAVTESRPVLFICPVRDKVLAIWLRNVRRQFFEVLKRIDPVGERPLIVFDSRMTPHNSAYLSRVSQRFGKSLF